MLSAVRSSLLIVLVLAFSQARVVQEEIFDPTQVQSALQPLIDGLRQAKQLQTTVTLTIIRTTTLSSVTTTVITTKKTCAVVTAAAGATIGGVSTYSAAPTNTCRRKRQFWDQNVFVALKDENDNSQLQYYRLSPSQVLSFEPTLLPQFRNTPYAHKGVQLVKESPLSIESSFEKSPDHLRVASPVFNGALNSIISSILATILTTFSTSTSLITAFTSTFTSTTFTASASYFVVGNCYPAGLSTC